MDLRKLKTIIELFESSHVSELEICEGEDRVRLSKLGSKPRIIATEKDAIQEVESAPSPAASPPPQPAQEESGKEEHVEGEILTSPMVGTFYRASAPDADPFVRVGDRVQQGQTLFIIEAMKLMNEISAPCDGVVSEISVENGSPVGFGDKLAVIK